MPLRRAMHDAYVLVETPSSRPYKRRRVCCSEQENAGCERVEPSVPTTMPRSPITPVKRQIQATVPEAAPVEVIETPIKSTTPSPSKCTSNVFAHARSLLRLSSDATTGDEQHLLGREDERSALTAFLARRLPRLLPGEAANDAGRAVLYVSGLPGTGKTALLHETVKRLQERAGDRAVDIIMINCLSLKDPQDVYAHLVNDAGKAQSAATLQDIAEKSLAQPGRGQILLILDEADRLVDGKRNILRQLFALANAPMSRLTIVAVANSLDITQLTAEGDEMPELLHFSPYDEKSLIAIAKQRLSLLHRSYDGAHDDVVATEDLPLFQPVAMQLLARKVQAHSGDLRSFLGLLRTVLAAVEEDQLKALPPTPAPSPTVSRCDIVIDALAHFTPATAPKATARHALAACKNARSNSGARMASIDPLSASVTNVTLGARLVLAGLALFSRDAASAVLDLSKAYAAYAAAIKRAGGRGFIDALTETEWRLTVENLDVAGLLRSSSTPSPVSKAKKARGQSQPTVELAYPFEKVLNAVATAGKSGECALAITLVDKNRVRNRITWEGDQEVPIAGFNGEGLDDKQVLGIKRPHEEVDDF